MNAHGRLAVAFTNLLHAPLEEPQSTKRAAMRAMARLACVSKDRLVSC